MQKMESFGAVRGHPRSWATPPVDRAHTYDFLFDFNRNLAPFSRYLSKVADFDPPHLHLAPRRE